VTRVRVLRVIARLNMGGPAHQAAILSGRRLDPDRFETLLVHGRVAPGETSMAYLAEREGAQTEFLPSLVQPVNPLADARALAGLISIARSFRPDIVHTHTAKAGFLGRIAALTLRPRPIIAHTFEGHVLEGYFGRAKTEVYRRLERSLGRRSDVLIGVSQATVDDLVRLGVGPRERFRVVRVGLDLDAFGTPLEGDRAAVRSELGLADQDFLVVFVGRVVPIKRLDVMLRAVAAAARQNTAIHLAVVGDGEIRADLERQAAALSVADRVHFLGYRQDLPRLFAAGDLAAVSSDNEGTPVSLIEAGAAGLPGVGTDVGGVSEVITEETGELVPPRDPDALAGAIARFAADDGRRRRAGDAARERVLQRYSAQRLVGDISGLYEELLAAR
jgi:glycosyltransferase involved in cell wall biosynthesis